MNRESSSRCTRACAARRAASHVVLLSGLFLQFAIAGSAFAQLVSDDTAIQAARAFADKVAARGTETYSRAFQSALDLAGQLGRPKEQGRSAPGRIQNIGDLNADPRYNSNIEAMVGGPTPKIWRGQRAPLGSFPDTVAVRGPGGLCTGTLITPDTVVTAAHCYCGNVRDVVIFGDETAKPGQRINVARSVSRIQCNTPLAGGDVALLFLEKSVQIPPRPIAGSALIDAAKEVTALGFGRTEDPVAEPIGIKRMVELPIASNSCSGSVPTAGGALEDSVYYRCNRGTELVAGLPRLDRDTCNGDSGGPVLVAGPGNALLLAGVTSRAVERPGLATCGDGGIYTRVDGEMRKWILSQGAKAGVDDLLAPTPTRSADAPAIAPPTVMGATVQLTDEQRLGLARLPARREISGVLIRRSEASVILTSADFGVKGETLALPVTNPKDITSVAVNSNARIVIRKENDGVAVENVTLIRITNLDNAAAILTKLRGPSEVTANISELTKAANAGSKPGSDVREEEKADISQLARMTESQIVQAFLRLSPNERQQRAELLKAFRGVKAQQKAVYGHDDRYRPHVYDEIFKTSRGGAAISKNASTDYFCSGALIGDDLLLTARHCMHEVFINEIEVTFNWEFDLANRQLEVDRYPVTGILNGDESASLDYVILRLGPNETTKQLPSKKWPTQCLDMKRVSRGDPIYVVGHPKGSARLVADNAIVYFPFETTQIEYGRLLLTLEAELEGMPDRDQRLKEFQESYRQSRNEQNEIVYKNYSMRFGALPTIGANTDTFQGNSGSPVYRRVGNRIIGIIYAGEPDLTTPLSPGWRRHEAILPILEIVKDMTRIKPKWMAEHGVCLKAN